MGQSGEPGEHVRTFSHLLLQHRKDGSLIDWLQVLEQQPKDQRNSPRMVQFDESGANVSTFGPLPHLRGPFDHGHDRINDERSLIDRFRSLDNNLINGTLPQWSNLINLVDM